MAPVNTPIIPADIIRTAAASCADSRTRFSSGDRTVTSDELAAYGALLTAAKAAGISDPFAGVVADAMPEALGHWRHRASPIAHRFA